jgi:hypothetical protein
MDCEKQWLEAVKLTRYVLGHGDTGISKKDTLEFKKGKQSLEW